MEGIEQPSMTSSLVSSDRKSMLWLTREGKLTGEPIERLRWWWRNDSLSMSGNCRFRNFLLWNSIACCRSACSAFLLIISCVLENILGAGGKQNKTGLRTNTKKKKKTRLSSDETISTWGITRRKEIQLTEVTIKEIPGIHSRWTWTRRKVSSLHLLQQLLLLPPAIVW